MERSEIFSVVKKHLDSAVDGIVDSTFDPDRSMDEYGASSLDVVTIVSGTMRELKIRIPRTELKNIRSTNDLVELFYITHTGKAVN